MYIYVDECTLDFFMCLLISVCMLVKLRLLWLKYKERNCYVYYRRKKSFVCECGKIIGLFFFYFYFVK